ncbi:hypothetical protein B0J12DRAFT_703346 [Macrophomina phaseolina]|uniref:SnoaL-like domain-containing protein n=1 Tax=Macrophomina phaseolina TaxID=35725 RepID=A0ABQ8G1Y6_9PEZI|nr:hypothetical protein B0J12DRAFT_703346 [Macrophomina phaseolina]
MHITALAASALALLATTVTASPWPPSTYRNTAASKSSPAGGAPYCPPRRATVAEQRAIFAEFVQKFLVEQNATRALLDHVSEDYIQHNPFFPSGRQVVLDAFTSFPVGATNATILNQAFDANRGFVHYRQDTAGAAEPSAIVDLYRFEGTCIMEHWDVIQERPANATNPLAMF